MTAEETAFLAKILAEPDDDTHRLVYADWLQENGRDDHAEFIRVQVELEKRFGSRGRLSGVPTHRCQVCRAFWVKNPSLNGIWSVRSLKCGACCDNAPMGDQMEPLRREDVSLFRREFLAIRELDPQLPAFLQPPDFVTANAHPRTHAASHRAVWVRGFLGEITCTASDWLANIDAIRTRYPVTRVRLTTDLDWHSPTYSGVIVLASDGAQHRCDRATYGCWWGKSGGTVPEWILRTEWPGIVFDLTADQ